MPKQPIVLITFYSRGGETEKIALAVAVGAVQARGLIRLRRMPDADAARVIEEFPQHKETLVRMCKEYAAPAEADLMNAGALVFVSPVGFTAGSPECRAYFEMLGHLRSQGKLEGKMTVTLDSKSNSVDAARLKGREIVGSLRGARA